MNDQRPDCLQIRVARPAEQSRALWLAFSGQPSAARPAMLRATLQRAQRGETCLDGLIIALRNRQMVGAAWGQLMPGKAAIVWPAQLVEGEPRATAEQLMKRTDDQLRRRKVRLSQAVLRCPSAADVDLLHRAGYRHAADLLYLVCPRERLPSAPPACPFELEPYRPAQRRRMEKLVEQTYEQTKDCPVLDGLRSVSDVLEGYLHTGSFSPDRWFFVRQAGRDVGCLLLTDHPEHDQWELVYLGLIPAARGQRWGEQMARYGLWLTRCAGRSQMALAVDAANEPAIRAYRAVGLESCERRSVFFKVFRNDV